MSEFTGKEAKTVGKTVSKMWQIYYHITSFFRMFKKSNAYKYAKQELKILTKNAEVNNRPVIEEFAPQIIALVERFGKSGQSGGSAPYVARALSNTIYDLCMFNPITPIIGSDDEWNNISEAMGKTCFQNNRLGAVFKNGKDGKPYYIDAISFVNDEGISYHGGAIVTSSGKEVRSSQNIKGFPFRPRTFYIKVREVEEVKDGWEFYIDDEEQLDGVKEYYDFHYADENNEK